MVVLVTTIHDFIPGAQRKCKPRVPCPILLMAHPLPPVAGSLDLVAGLRAALLAALPVDGSNAELLTSLAAMPVSHLLIRYLNWRGRLVHPRPRKVEKSKELLANPVYVARRREVLPPLVSRAIWARRFVRAVRVKAGPLGPPPLGGAQRP